MNKANAPKDVYEYIAGAPINIQSKLEQLRAAIKEVAPTSTEGISYKMPYYRYNGGALAWFAFMKSHIGLYMRPPLIQEHKKELVKYETTKSAIRFPLDEELPITLIKKLVKARMEMNEQAEN